MARYIFDCETNGLLDSMDRIHSLCLMDADTKEEFSLHGDGIENGVRALMEADEIIGHNIMQFDIPAIQIVYPWFKPEGKVTDTLLLSRLIYADLRERDFGFIKKQERRLRLTGKGEVMPKKLIGSHGLEAWGHRLGLHKGDYAKQREKELRQRHTEFELDPPTKEQIAHYVWGTWSQDMQDYCELDVLVTYELYKLQMQKGFSDTSIWLEHEFQKVIMLQEQHGFHFDVGAARELQGVLSNRRAEIENELQIAFPPKQIKMRSQWWVTPDGKEWATKKEAVLNGYKAKDVTKGRFKTKAEPFNPGSRTHIAARFKEKYDWQPDEFTNDGKPKVDETILSKLEYPEAKLLSEYLMIQKRLGQLAEGAQAWLRLEKKGRIHGRVITNGAVSGRCTHQRPNMAQVPSVGAPYGFECRSLFVAPKGYKLVGADASGLELRCLSHYLFRFDEGAYRDIILSGDIHWANATALGLVGADEVYDEHNEKHIWARNKVSKRFIYAYLYGGGDQKLGEILEPTASAKRQKAIGKKLRAKFESSLPAFARLRQRIAATVKKKGYLKAIDGRKLHIRSEHSALNQLLQSAGSLNVKLATVFLYEDLSKLGYVFGEDYALVAHVHDEVQLIAKEGLEDIVGQTAVTAFKRAGEFFGFNCPLDGEYKVGNNWAETH